MKANEFVKQHGWDYVMVHLDILKAERWTGSFFNDLKRLVESWELVESNGGYNSVKAMFEDLHCVDLDDWDNDLELLARAMSDVESCK